ncbi:MAG: hypothetical protein HGA39_05935 [Coriobacteriia bacterium]|nr:hypothetical protein [Coriobacteriia bacterium]
MRRRKQPLPLRSSKEIRIRLAIDELAVATARVLGFERTRFEVREAVLSGIRLLIKSSAAVQGTGIGPRK